MDKKEYAVQKIKGSLEDKLARMPGAQWSNLHLAIQSYFILLERMKAEVEEHEVELLADALSVISSEEKCTVTNVVFDLQEGKIRISDFVELVEERCGSPAASMFEEMFSSDDPYSLAVVHLAALSLYRERGAAH